MKNPIIIIIILTISFVAIGYSIYKLYKDFDKLESSDPLNDDFDEHTDQFII